MCRFLAYRGKPVLLDEILHKPTNSLIKQSAQAHEAEEPLNGDGFGVGWYTPEIDDEPGLFVSVRPAWNDRNLRYMCRHIATPTLFAHVRAASEGEVSESNCHPFHFKRYLFMHNGGIGGFQKLKRQIRRRLTDEIYDWVRGQTDSEHLFALFLENLPTRNGKSSAQEMAHALEKTIQEIARLKAEAGITEECYINCCVTDGESMVAIRYVSDTREKASTLYYSEGHHYECDGGVCRMVPMKGIGEHAVLIVSEKLTDSPADWKEIPTNTMCLVDEKRKVKIQPIDDGITASLAQAAGAETALGKAKGFRPKLKA
jgi:predicted glutamine amidotransferase